MGAFFTLVLADVKSEIVIFQKADIFALQSILFRDNQFFIGINEDVFIFFRQPPVDFDIFSRVWKL